MNVVDTSLAIRLLRLLHHLAVVGGVGCNTLGVTALTNL
jgi:hypothetical protein